MLKVIIRGNWSDCVGTDYCAALGLYDTLEQANDDAECYANESWEPQEQDEEDTFMEPEGPDYWIEEYDPEKHDILRAGGGSFEDEFNRM